VLTYSIKISGFPGREGCGGCVWSFSAVALGRK
jgi:hypothetical protein